VAEERTGTREGEVADDPLFSVVQRQPIIARRAHRLADTERQSEGFVILSGGLRTSL
jgi:hypothetical protein